jgi:F0F1-type ATP synthase assembly protein I
LVRFQARAHSGVVQKIEMETKEKEVDKKKSRRETLMYSFRLSAWIGAPVIVALLLGKALDRWLDTSPWFFLGLTGFAFLISMFGLVKESKEYLATLTKESDKKDVTNTTDTTK